MQTRLWIRKLHKWIGVGACVFMLLVASTALALNHRDLWLRAQGAAGQNFSLAQARIWAADPFAHNHLLAADDSHLWQSRDQGQHWQELKLYVPAEHVTGIVFDPQTKGRLWVALRDVGVYASDDGEIWSELESLPFDPVAGEAIDSLSAGDHQLYVKTALGLYLYTPASDAWQKPSQASQASREQSLTLQDWIWRLHTGHGFGPAVLMLYDGIASSLILISLSGLVLAWRPRRRKTSPSVPAGQAV